MGGERKALLSSVREEENPATALEERDRRRHRAGEHGDHPVDDEIAGLFLVAAAAADLAYYRLYRAPAGGGTYTAINGAMTVTTFTDRTVVVGEAREGFELVLEGPGDRALSFRRLRQGRFRRGFFRHLPGGSPLAVRAPAH